MDNIVYKRQPKATFAKNLNLKKGELTSLGYHADLPVSQRHKALDKAVKEYGAGSVIRKLNVLFVLDRYRAPIYSETFNADKKYLQRKYEGK